MIVETNYGYCAVGCDVCQEWIWNLPSWNITSTRTVSSGKVPSFIMVTAAGSENVTTDAFSMGASYYVMKPINREIVVDKMRRARMHQNPDSSFQEAKKVRPYIE